MSWFSLVLGNAACNTALATNRMQQPEPTAGPNGNVNNAGSIKNPSNGGNNGNVTKVQIVSSLKNIPEKAPTSGVNFINAL